MQVGVTVLVSSWESCTRYNHFHDMALLAFLILYSDFYFSINTPLDIVQAIKAFERSHIIPL